MGEKRFAGLTIEQLDAAGAAAGADALARAHGAGLPSPGMTKFRLASGDEIKVLTRLHPDGTLEIVDDRIALRPESKKEQLLRSREGTNNRSEDVKSLLRQRGAPMEESTLAGFSERKVSFQYQPQSKAKGS